LTAVHERDSRSKRSENAAEILLLRRDFEQRSVDELRPLA
jgi:hypothetical protein